jgi:hypothetical protein
LSCLAPLTPIAIGESCNFYYAAFRDNRILFARLNIKLILCFIFELKFRMDSKVKYWIELSDYDLETAEAIIGKTKELQQWIKVRL